MASVRILITGSRIWEDEKTIRQALRHIWKLYAADDPILVHGGANGADTIAGKVWKTFGGKVEVHKANWDTLGRRAGYVRNAEMVAAGATLCIAFIASGSRGATMCADLAEAAGIPTRRIRRL